MSSGFTSENDFHRALAAKLAAIRVEYHASQSTLAAELGTDQGTVSRVESGHRRLTVAEAFAWLEALGLKPKESAACLSDLWQTYGERPPGFWNEVSRD